MRRGWWIAAGGVLATVVVVVVTLVVLSGGDDASTQPTTAPPAGAMGAVSEEFQDCLAEQGVDFGAATPSGEPDAEMSAAFEACQEFLPEMPQGGDLPAVPPDGDGFAPPSSG